MDELLLLMKENESLSKSTEGQYRLMRNIAIIDCRNKEECLSDKLASETLQNLNLSINQLPQRCQNLVRETSTKLSSLGYNKLEMLPVFLERSKSAVDHTVEEEELLELRLINHELQLEIDANKKFIENLKKELELQKDFLDRQNPQPGCPDYNSEHVKEMKLKLGTFKEELEKAQNNYSKLQVPACVQPASLLELIEQLAEVKKEETFVREKADDILCARKARDTLISLRRGEE